MGLWLGVMCCLAAGVAGGGEVLHRDDFTQGLARWQVECDGAGTVEAGDGRLVIDVPKGCTVWFQPELEGPIEISYEATVIDAGGPNDRVSDLNCFWMASDARNEADFFAVPRRGKFGDYDELRAYYVGFGGHDNTRTRFRRYLGEKGNRPLLPGHDLADEDVLLRPNVAYRIRLVADGRRIEYHVDDRKLFELDDAEPYVRGRFGFRTLRNHMEVRAFEVRSRAAAP